MITTTPTHEAWAIVVTGLAKYTVGSMLAYLLGLGLVATIKRLARAKTKKRQAGWSQILRRGL